jgi:dynein heavy chain 2
MRSLVTHAQGVNQWVRRAQAGQLLGGPVVLGELFHPDTFLNALRQHTARQRMLLLGVWFRSVV